MALDDSKRFYWFKCDHEFFNGTKMVRLRKSKTFDVSALDGEEMRQIVSLAMQAVYIKLLAESCTHEGELLYDDGVPYDDEGLSEIVECPESFIKFTKDRLKKLHLLEEDDDGKLTLTELPEYIGCETGAAKRKRGERSDVQGQTGTMSPSVPKCPQMSPAVGTNGENVTKSIENRDKSIEKRKNKEDIFFSPKPPKGADDGQEAIGVKAKGSDEFDHVTRNDVRVYFQRMRNNGHKQASPETEEEFWQYLVGADFKKGDGMPIQKHNLHTTISVWLGNKVKVERKETAEKAAEEAKAREDAAREERIQKLLLSEDED